MEDVVLLGEVSIKDIDKIGKKAAYLAELYNKKFPVPPAFLITGSLFVKFVDIVGIKDVIAELLNSDMDSKKKSNEIQKTIIGSRFPDDMANFLYENYTSLNVEGNVNNMVQSQQEPFVALRISSTSDEIDDAFFLNIKGRDRLTSAVKACWASLFSEKNLPLKRFKPCIIVQKMINSKKSGYIYSANPFSNNPNEIVIEVCSGLGNGLSLNQVKASKYILNKEEYDIISSELIEQAVQYTLDYSQEKTVKMNLDEPVRNIMDEFIIRELAKFGKKIELRFNSAQKVLFGIDKHIFILGTRDITIQSATLEPKEVEVQEEFIQAGPQEPTAEEAVSEQSVEGEGQAGEVAEEEFVPVEQESGEQPKKEELGSFIEEQPEEPEKPKEQENTEAQGSEEEDEFFDEKEESNIEYEKAVEMSDDSLRHYDESHSLEQSEGLEQSEEKEEEPSEEKQEQESFMNQYMDNKPEIAYQKAISFNSSMLVISCDMTILSSLKNKYKSVFAKDPHNYFNELINELKMRVNIPYEGEIKRIHQLRDSFLNEYKELSPQDISFVLDSTRKFLCEF